MSESAAILLAAGRGSRMRGVVDDKVLAPLAGRLVFVHSLEAFATAGIVARCVVVYRDAAQRTQLAALYASGPMRDLPVRWVRGGRERQDSVARALAALPRATDFVFIHDCARPLVRPEVLRELDLALRRDGAACLAHRVTDTIKRLPAGAPDANRRRLATLDRERLWAMETPQAFARTLIVAAYAEVQRRGLRITDDAQAVEIASHHGVTLVENPHPNPKITRPADLRYVEFLLSTGGIAPAATADSPPHAPQ
jgi:2-C-methyl-D-erythritol 4-phosphate cytidylyltransferase